ncbi:MAG: HYExAFE family protein [Phycisphaerales bacterium]|nr:HYExAFE family protein [Phycisphaerales bacterium]
MAQRRHHYEQAFEAYLRDKRMPYVAVNEARKALLPHTSAFHAVERGDASLKSFDFVVYGQGQNLLVEVKGRRLPAGGRRLESWVHADDVRSMQTWEPLFGPEFRAVFVFLYWCDELPADGLFEEIIEHRGRWYALRVTTVDEYARCMKVRSPRWGTVCVENRHFVRISHPFRGTLEGLGGGVGAPAPALEPLGP